MIVTGSQSIRWIHGAGWNSASRSRRRITTIGPTTKITNTAGPSPLSAKLKSRPQTSQRGATLEEAREQTPLAAARAAAVQAGGEGRDVGVSHRAF